MTARSEPRLKQISISSPPDISRLFDLMHDFHFHPEKANHVTSLVLKCTISDGIFSKKLQSPWKTREAERTPPESSVYEVVNRLAFQDQETAREWTKMLTWMAPDAVEDRQRDWTQESGYNAFVALQDSRFAHHAAAVLAVQCTNLEKLVYLDDDGCITPFVEFLRWNNYGLLAHRYLQNLREAELIPNGLKLSDDRFYVDMDILPLLHMFHRLPSLRMFTAQAFTIADERGYTTRFPPASSTLKCILLRHVNIPSSVLAALIRAPMALEEITCTIGGRASSDGSFQAVFPETIGRALWCQRTSLRKLDLDVDDHILSNEYYSPDEEDGELDETDSSDEQDQRKPWEREAKHVRTSRLETGRNYSYGIGSLHDFPQLTHLSIGVRMLLAHNGQTIEEPEDHANVHLVDILPPSLEHLLLRGYERGEREEWDEQIDELLRYRRERFPRLYEVLGVEEKIPIAHDVGMPDENRHELWKRSDKSDGWQCLEGQ